MSDRQWPRCPPAATIQRWCRQNLGKANWITDATDASPGFRRRDRWVQSDSSFSQTRESERRRVVTRWSRPRFDSFVFEARNVYSFQTYFEPISRSCHRFFENLSLFCPKIFSIKMNGKKMLGPSTWAHWSVAVLTLLCSRWLLLASFRNERYDFSHGSFMFAEISHVGNLSLRQGEYRRHWSLYEPAKEHFEEQFKITIAYRAVAIIDCIFLLWWINYSIEIESVNANPSQVLSTRQEMIKD